MKPLELLIKYSANLTRDERENLLRHSEKVLKKSLQISNKHKEFKVNINKLKKMALLHDIGVCKLSTNTPYIMHGILGSKILEEEGFKDIAKVCERHIGSGITKKEAKSLGLPEKNMLPRTLEEKIICYADKFYSKSKSGKHRISEVRREFKKYGQDELKRFENLHKTFS